MKFAMVNGIKSEATPNLRGTCPLCESELVAKCGEVKVHHWAHKSNRNCDQWWEKETEWHRNWKNLFPIDWQEKVFKNNETNEKHIADIYTPQGLTLEFQHSFIKSEERLSRENFYNNLIWIVDGTRIKRDFSKFCKNYSSLMSTPFLGVLHILFADEIFPKNWLNSKVPVIFDFKGAETSSSQEKELSEILWALYPSKIDNQSIVFSFNREPLIQMLTHNPEGFYNYCKDKFYQYFNYLKTSYTPSINRKTKPNRRHFRF